MGQRGWIECWDYSGLCNSVHPWWGWVEVVIEGHEKMKRGGSKSSTIIARICMLNATRIISVFHEMQNGLRCREY